MDMFTDSVDRPVHGLGGWTCSRIQWMDLFNDSIDGSFPGLNGNICSVTQ